MWIVEAPHLCSTCLYRSSEICEDTLSGVILVLSLLSLLLFHQSLDQLYADVTVLECISLEVTCSPRRLMSLTYYTDLPDYVVMAC